MINTNYVVLISYLNVCEFLMMIYIHIIMKYIMYIFCFCFLKQYLELFVDTCILVGIENIDRLCKVKNVSKFKLGRMSYYCYYYRYPI